MIAEAVTNKADGVWQRMQKDEITNPQEVITFLKMDRLRILWRERMSLLIILPTISSATVCMRQESRIHDQ